MQPDNPSYQSPSYKAQTADWALVNDAFIGTEQVRAKGVTYLPKSPAEHKDDYAARLAQAVFWNAFKRTVEGLTGMVFRKSPKFSTNTPPQISSKETGDAENIDNAGSHFDVFTKRTFKTALIDGHSFILVDMPPVVVVGDNAAGAVTRADYNGRRPYWVHVNANQVVNWETEAVNGKTILSQVTIQECVTEKVGQFIQREIIQYRVLRPGSWEIWRKAADRDELVIYDEGQTLANGAPLDVIPLAPIYCNQTGYFQSQPPLIDLAQENFRHYRLQSDLDNILHVANVPIGWVKGRIIKRDAAGNEIPFSIGPNTWLDLTADPNSGVGYSEHTGSAIGAAQAEIDKSRSNMAALGLLLLSQRPNVQTTATENIIDSEAESSELAGMVRGLTDGVEMALGFHAMFRNLPSGGSVDFNKDFTRIKLDAQKIQVYANMVAVGDMELEALYWMLEQAEDLPPDYDTKKAIERLKAEKAKAQDYSLEVLKSRSEFLKSPTEQQDVRGNGQAVQ